MKTFLPISVFLVAFFACSEAVKNPVAELKMLVPKIEMLSSDSSITKKQNGDIYFNSDPFSGYLISRHISGSINVKKGYVDGKQNGLTKAYYPDGSLKYERPYLNGEKHGIHIGYHKNGQKAFEYYFEYGFNEGNHIMWFEDGQKSSDMNYLNGKEFGRQQAWRPDGKLRANYIVRENGRMYGLQGIKRCTKLDGETQTIDPYKGKEE